MTRNSSLTAPAFCRLAAASGNTEHGKGAASVWTSEEDMLLEQALALCHSQFSSQGQGMQSKLFAILLPHKSMESCQQRLADLEAWCAQQGLEGKTAGT